MLVPLSSSLVVLAVHLPLDECILHYIGPSVLRAPAEQTIGPSVLRAPAEQTIGPSVLRAPAEQTKVATVLGNWSERRCADGV